MTKFIFSFLLFACLATSSLAWSQVNGTPIRELRTLRAATAIPAQGVEFAAAEGDVLARVFSTGISRFLGGIAGALSVAYYVEQTQLHYGNGDIPGQPLPAYYQATNPDIVTLYSRNHAGGVDRSQHRASGYSGGIDESEFMKLPGVERNPD